MEKKRGRPAGRNYTTLLIAVTKEEAEQIKNAHKAWIDTHGIKISKSQFVRKHLDGLFKN